MNKEIALLRARRLPLLLLCSAAAMFLVCVLSPLWYPPNVGMSALRAVSEAALVGGLADWFAVSALFRRVPVPLIGRHTAIIPRRKDHIADNLALFVQEKFLHTDALLALIRRHDPVQRAADWLSSPENAARAGEYLLRMLRSLLNVTDDSRIQCFMQRAVHRAIDSIDLSPLAARVLDSLTKNNRHQALLDDAIAQLLRLVNNPTTHAFIAQQVMGWLKREHPIKEKLLPTSWVSEKSARIAADAVRDILNDIEQDNAHVLRQGFNHAVQRLIVRLKNDSGTLFNEVGIKTWLKQDPAFNTYISELWHDLRGWLKADVDRPDSVLLARTAAAGQWLGETLTKDTRLRASLNQHLEQAAIDAAPAFSAFLSRHISDTVKSWNAEDTSRQIELNIGTDLQRIRVNGTLVGGIIGLMLWGLSQLPALLH